MKNADGASLIQTIFNIHENFFDVEKSVSFHLFTYLSCLCLDVITKNWLTLRNRNDIWRERERERTCLQEQNVSEKYT